MVRFSQVHFTITNRGHVRCTIVSLARAGQGALLRLHAVAQRETSGNDEEYTTYGGLDREIVAVFLSLV